MNLAYEISAYISSDYNINSLTPDDLRIWLIATYILDQDITCLRVVLPKLPIDNDPSDYKIISVVRENFCGSS